MSFARKFLAVLLLALMPLPAAQAQGSTSQEELISNAGFTFRRLIENEDFQAAQVLMKRARAIMIFPSLLKGAFFLGGEGGSGVLLVRRPDNSWSYPAFYTLGSVSFGLQIGGQSSAAVLLVMNDKALRALLEDQVKLGGDLSAAVGPVGAGIAASATTSFGEDMYTYSTTKGLFIGASLEGAIIARREDWNGDFYNGVVAPAEIVMQDKVSNAKADPLRALLRDHATPQ